jgi:hypothetical protein
MYSIVWCGTSAAPLEVNLFCRKVKQQNDGVVFIKEGPPIFKEALDTFYIEVMKGCAELECQATPKFFNANMFRAVQTSFQQILKINNRADFF